MNSEAAFKRLLGVANFGVTARNAIVEFCAENIEDLARLPKKTLDTSILNLHKSLADVAALRRVRLNATKCTLLHSIRMHFNDRLNCSAPLEAADLALLTNDDILVMKAEYIENEESLHDTSGLSPVIVSKLEPLKWSAFKTSMLEYFSRVIGKNNVPLTYICRPDGMGDFDEVYESRVDKLISCTSLHGAKFKADNGTFFSLLVQYTNNTEGYSLVQQYEKSRNGRKAWNSLLGHFEGSTFRERVAQEAGTMIRTASYSGPRRNFTFSSYYDKHSTAHLKLSQAGKPMSTEQQIDSFVAGIQCATAQQIVVNLAGDQTVRTSFETYYNAVASRLELSLSLTHMPTNRETRTVNQLKGKLNKRPYKAKNDRTSKYKKYSTDTNFIPEKKSYAPDVWKNLSFANKEKVRALFRQNKSERGHFPPAAPQNYGMIPYNTQRSANQIGTHMAPQISTQMVPYQNQSYPSQRSVASMSIPASLPPYPSSIQVPTPPPPPPTSFDPNNPINSNAGNVGQHFGGQNGWF